MVKWEVDKMLTRRGFLLQAAGVAATGIGCSLDDKSSLPTSTFESEVPQRMLGKTGVPVSLLAFGCGGRFLKGYPSDDKALEVLNWVLSKGINYLDTAHYYGEGESERRVGLFLKDHRKEVFVVTKLGARDRENFMRQFELSLKRLQTDRVDLLHIHGLDTVEEVEQIGAKGGIYECLVNLKEQRGTRFIGFSCHSSGQVAKAAIAQYEFDCCMLQLNAAKIGGFEDTALPAALRKNMGVVAMKATGQERLLGYALGKGRIEELLRYAWNLPVASVILGMPDLKMVKQDIELARNFKRMSRSEKESLRARLAGSRPDLERFFCHHSDFEMV
jgi:uncharacterized protein